MLSSFDPLQLSNNRGSSCSEQSLRKTGPRRLERRFVRAVLLRCTVITVMKTLQGEVTVQLKPSGSRSEVSMDPAPVS